MQTPSIWPERPKTFSIPLNVYSIMAALILILAVASRFTLLGQRVMSHDEINHVVPAFDYSEGRGYRYDPVTHGPLQFHLIAFSYFLLGDNDFSARVPAALFSVAAIALVLFLFKPYLGKSGALIGAGLLLISPFILYYGRYARNEAFTVVWSILTLYAMLRYLQSGETGMLYLFTLVNAFHFVDKATSYIYAAEQILFLGSFFLLQISRKRWPAPAWKKGFWVSVCLAVVCAAAALGMSLLTPQPAAESTIQTGPAINPILLAGVVGTVLLLGLAFFCLIKGAGQALIRSERSFDLLFLLSTLLIPLLAALLLKLFGVNPLDTSPAGITRSIILVLVMLFLSAAAGWWWKRRLWFEMAGIFWVIFLVFYTSFFSNLPGFGAGWMGALSYWADQQAVQRGSQPWYYYLLLQIPVYEFLPAAGTLVATGIAARRRLWQAAPYHPFTPPAAEPVHPENANPPLPTYALLLYWAVINLVAFSIAGEKMPWLTVNITAPLILCSAWGMAYLIETFAWKASLSRATIVPFVIRSCLAIMFAVLALFTFRTAYRAAYINYDNAREFLVYAHTASDPKWILSQIEEISRRTTGGLDLVVAYDNDVRYPYWWYLRHYPKRIDFDTQPSRRLREAAVILAGEANYARIEPIVGDDYLQSDYMRLWWPMQDYYGLTWDTVQKVLGNPALRNAIWQIWFKRDYSAYAALTQRNDLTLENWQPSSRMRMYIRKDVAANLWGGDFDATTSQGEANPYLDKIQPISPVLTIDGNRVAEPRLNAPRGLALAPDGSFYLADSKNHRILHLTSTGNFLNAWGSYADIAAGQAPGGTFNEPWGVAVSDTGMVYVSDTWNHRIQQFDPNGKFIRTWGAFGQSESPLEMWGPRGIAVDAQGHVYVVDTGNKRILIFDQDGEPLAQFGGAGDTAGQFNEPVGIAFDGKGRVYVTDTWNRRIQVFTPNLSTRQFPVYAWWSVDGWYGESLDNKPFIAIDRQGHVFASNPEGGEIFEFSNTGEILAVWQISGPDIATNAASILSGIAIDRTTGMVWFSDAKLQRLTEFNPGQP